MHLKARLKIYNEDVELNIDDVLKILKKEKQYTIPIFIPHLGCKHECVFCNQRKISGAMRAPTTEDVKNTIDKYLSYFDNTAKIQIAFFGGSFTGIKIAEQEKYLKIAYEYVKSGRVDSIRLSTRPDYISEPILNLLKTYKVKSIELGVQTMSEDVLMASKRGHSAIDVINAANLINSYGFDLGFQIMIGLPKSTALKEVKTINTLLRYNPKELRIYPVYVINPSELYDMYLSKEYVPLTISQSIDRTYQVVKECLKSNIKIIRLGLQSTDEITQNNKEILGPVCDNFAEYVFARLALDKIEPIIVKLKSKNSNLNEVTFNISKSTPISFVIGPKKINEKYIFDKYKVKIRAKVIEK